MSNTISIRPARESDVPGILEIYNDAILNTTALYTYEPFTLPMMQQWYADKIAKDLPVFVAVEAASDTPGQVASTGQATAGVAGFASYGPFRPHPAYKY